MSLPISPRLGWNLVQHRHQIPLEPPHEDLLELKFIPAHRRSKPGKFPLTVNFSIPVLDHGMPVSLVLYRLVVGSGVPLMSSSQLVLAENFFCRDLLPFRCSDVVLRVDKGISQEACMAHDSNELFGRQIIPFVAIDLTIVDLTGGGVSTRRQGKENFSNPVTRTIRVGASILRSRSQSLSS